MTTPGSARLGILLVLGAAVLWGVLGPVARVALAEGVAPIELAFWRAALTAAAFGAHALATGCRWPAGRDLPRVAAFGLVGIALLFIAYFTAVARGGAALTTVLLYTAPAIVTVVVWLRHRGRLHWTAWTAVALTLAGVAGASNLGAVPLRGREGAILWGLASGFAFACYTLMAKPLVERYGTAASFAPAMAVGAMGILPLVGFQPGKSGAAWGAIAFAGLVPGYLAALCYAEGLRRLEANRAAVIATVEPVVAVALSVVLWGESLTPAMAGGTACILAAVLLSARPARGQKTEDRG